MQLRELVAAHLRPTREESLLLETDFTLALHDQAGPIGAEAVAGCGWGLDHFGGEHVLAAALSRSTPKRYEHRLTLAITDRRTIVNGWSSTKGGLNDIRFCVPHDLITRVEVKDGILANHVKLFVGGQVYELGFTEITEPLGKLFTALAQLHPQARSAPPIPLPEVSATDPAAARAGAQSLWRQDPPINQAMIHIDQLVSGGQIEAASGYDFVCRLLMAHRSAIAGPGGSPALGQTWLSPMSAQDLGHTLVGIYGPPAHYQVTDGWAWHQFRIDPNRDYLGAVLSALGVAAFVGLGFGFSPGAAIAHQLLKRDPITSIRVGIRDGSACSMYVVEGPRGKLENSDANMAYRLHQALIHSAYRVLERRCVLGWAVEHAALFR